MIDLTRIFSESPGTCGRRQHTPRTTSSIGTPAAPASYSLSIVRRSDSAFILAQTPLGLPALPITPDFKGNLVARYSFGLGNFDAYTQGAVVYSASRASQLEIADNDIYGDIPSSTFLDLSFGLKNDTYALELFVSNATNEDAPLGINTECATSVCGVQPLAVRARPRTIGIRFSQEF